MPRALSKIFQEVSHREQALCSLSCGPVTSQDPERRSGEGVQRASPQVSTVSFNSCVTPKMLWKATEAPYTQALTWPQTATGRLGSP